MATVTIVKASDALHDWGVKAKSQRHEFKEITK